MEYKSIGSSPKKILIENNFDVYAKKAQVIISHRAPKISGLALSDGVRQGGSKCREGGSTDKVE